MNTSARNCPSCHSNAWAMTSKVGPLETWHCDRCHHEKVIHVYDPSIEFPLLDGHETVFELVGHWRSKPTKEQAGKLTSLVPALRHAQASTLIRSALAGAPLSLGRFTNDEAREIEPLLLSLGLAVERTSIQLFNRRKGSRMCGNSEDIAR